MFGAPVQVTECRTAKEVITQAALARENRRKFFAPPIAPAAPVRIAIREAPDVEVIADLARRLCIPFDSLQARINELVHEVKTKQPSVRLVMQAVCSVFGIKRIELESSRRGKACVPRHIAMCIIRNQTTVSLTQIGRAFGRRDHTTCIHAINKLQPTYDAALQSAGVELISIITSMKAILDAPPATA